MSHQHDWIKSTLGHGETMCRRCKITNREAAVLGENTCPVSPQAPAAAAPQDDIPTVLAGHWETAEGADMARRNADFPRDRLTMGNISDFALANAIYMADRNSPDLLPIQTAAKERIRWLSIQLALANVAKSELVTTAQALLTEIRAYSSPECDQEGEIGAAELKALDSAIAKAIGAA